MAGMAKRLADDDLLLGELSPCFQVGHYHSWCADRTKLPDDWEVTAEVEGEPDIVLAMRHRALPLNAVQFHPESVLTPDGRRILKAWLSSLQP
jgi:anthranilate synthase component 2